MSNELIKGLKFHHIGLKCADLDKSIAFYTEALGMKPYAAWGEGDKRIQMLTIGDGGIFELFAGGGDEYSNNGKWIHLAMEVEDVDAAFDMAVSHGAKPLTYPKTVPLDSVPEKMTINIAFVKGPDGEELEFFKLV